MTCAFTRRFGTVYACDLDAGFLERCREAVARFGASTGCARPGARRADARGRRRGRRRGVQLHHAAALLAQRRRWHWPVSRCGCCDRAGRSRSTSAPGVDRRASAAARDGDAGGVRVPGIGAWLSRHRDADPARVAGQPARSAPRGRPVGERRRRRGDLAQPVPLGAGVGRRRSELRYLRASTRLTGGSSPRRADHNRRCATDRGN